MLSFLKLLFFTDYFTAYGIVAVLSITFYASIEKYFGPLAPAVIKV